jgi:hypothetical protein
MEAESNGVYKRLPLDIIQSYVNTVHNLIFYLFKMYFNITIESISWFPYCSNNSALNILRSKSSYLVG